MLTSRRIRVLVVDDDVNALSALGALLRDSEHEVVLAHDGVDALVKLSSFRPDVVVTDMRMPRMDGLALYDAVALLPIPMPRFVFMSAMRAARSRRQHALHHQAHLHRPPDHARRRGGPAMS